MEIFINLLPPDKKNSLKKTELRKTILKIGFSAVFASAIFAIFIQFCVWFILTQKKVVDDRIIQFEQNESYAKTKTSQDLLREYSLKARRIKSKISTQNDYWKIISEINKIVPEQVYLKEVSVREGVLVVVGNSLDRQALIVFHEKLKKSELFGEIESPISNFVASKDVNFEFIVNLQTEAN